MYIQHNTISIDIAKKVCQVHYILTSGKTVNRQIKTVKLTEYLVQFPSSIIAMEACGMSRATTPGDGSHREQKQTKILDALGKAAGVTAQAAEQLLRSVSSTW